MIKKFGEYKYQYEPTVGEYFLLKKDPDSINILFQIESKTDNLQGYNIKYRKPNDDIYSSIYFDFRKKIFYFNFFGVKINCKFLWRGMSEEEGLKEYEFFETANKYNL